VNLFEQFAGDLNRPVYPGDCDSSESDDEGISKGITIGELLLNLFDLVATHKATNSLTHDIWSLLRLAVPEQTDIAAYRVAEMIVRAHIREAVVVRTSPILINVSTTTNPTTTTVNCTTTINYTTDCTCLSRRLLRILRFQKLCVPAHAVLPT
jgi:hypothetical protein